MLAGAPNSHLPGIPAPPEPPGHIALPGPDVTHYPVMLDLRGRRAVVVGGGDLAAAKVRGLLEAGANVEVIAPELSEEALALAHEGRVTWHRRPFQAGDLAGAAVAISVPDNPQLAAAVWDDAEASNVLLNTVDDVPRCRFIAPSVHRAGAITIAVSSGGSCPALAVRIRQRAADLAHAEHAQFVHIASELREEIARRVPGLVERRRLWYQLVDSSAIAQLAQHDEPGARATINALIAGATTRPRSQGKVWLVGAGPGDPDLLTHRATTLLSQADLVLHDRLIPPAALALASHSARIVSVGKTGFGPATQQATINQLLIDGARAGLTVVRLKGGDPFVFGRGAEEVAALREAGVACEVVPGVSSATAVPTAAGVPLTDRDIARGFAVVSAQDSDGAAPPLDWGAVARMPTIVVLMTGRGLERTTARLMDQGCSPGTPAALISQGTMPSQRTVCSTLGGIAEAARRAKLPTPTMLVVGEVARGAPLATNGALVEAAPA